MVGRYRRRVGIEKPGGVSFVQTYHSYGDVERGSGYSVCAGNAWACGYFNDSGITCVAINQLDKVYNRTHPAARFEGYARLTG